MKKKILSLGLGVALSVMGVNAMAASIGTVTLYGQNLPGQVYVACTVGKTTYPAWFPIPANGRLGPLSDSIVRSMFYASSLGATPMPCTFTINGAQVGTADLSIAADNSTMEVTNIAPISGYKVNAPTGYQANLSITLIG